MHKIGQRFPRFRLGAILFACLTLFAAGYTFLLRAQEIPTDVVIIGHVAKESLTDAYNSAISASVEGSRASDDIAQARRRFWEAYPSGPGFAEAEGDFARKLLAKDFCYLIIYLLEGPDSPRAKLAETVTHIDNGIRPEARSAFIDWVQEVRRGLGARSDSDLIFSGPAQISTSLSNSVEKYLAYKELRDWAEFQASGLDVKRFLTPKSYVLKILENRYASEHSIAGMQKLNPADEAHQVFATVVRLVGEKSVIQAGEVLLKAQKNERGFLVAPITCQSPFIIDVATASDPFWEFGALVTSYDDRGYAVGCCLGNFWRTMWQDAQDKFSSYVSKYGEKAVISAAAKIRSARKMGDGTLSDPSGNAPQPPKVWLGKLLAGDALPSTDKPPVFKASDPESLRPYIGKTATVTGTIADISKMEFGPFYLKLKEGPVKCEVKGSQLDLYSALRKGSEFKIGTPIEAFGYIDFSNNDWYVAVLTMKAL